MRSDCLGYIKPNGRQKEGLCEIHDIWETLCIQRVKKMVYIANLAKRTQMFQTEA